MNCNCSICREKRCKHKKELVKRKRRSFRQNSKQLIRQGKYDDLSDKFRAPNLIYH